MRPAPTKHMSEKIAALKKAIKKASMTAIGAASALRLWNNFIT